MVLADRKNGMRYLRDLVRHHVSGQMKIAPEHSEDHVLEKMGKPVRHVKAANQPIPISTILGQ